MFACQMPWVPELMFSLNISFGFVGNMYDSGKKKNENVTSDDVEAITYGILQPGELNIPWNGVGGIRKLAFE